MRLRTRRAPAASLLGFKCSWCRVTGCRAEGRRAKQGDLHQRSKARALHIACVALPHNPNPHSWTSASCILHDKPPSACLISNVLPFQLF